MIFFFFLYYNDNSHNAFRLRTFAKVFRCCFFLTALGEGNKCCVMGLQWIITVMNACLWMHVLIHMGLWMHIYLCVCVGVCVICAALSPLCLQGTAGNPEGSGETVSAFRLSSPLFISGTQTPAESSTSSVLSKHCRWVSFRKQKRR